MHKLYIMNYKTYGQYFFFDMVDLFNVCIYDEKTDRTLCLEDINIPIFIVYHDDICLTFNNELELLHFSDILSKREGNINLLDKCFELEYTGGLTNEN